MGGILGIIFDFESSNWDGVIRGTFLADGFDIWDGVKSSSAQ